MTVLPPRFVLPPRVLLALAAALAAATCGCAALGPRPVFMAAVSGDEQALLDYAAGLDADDRGRQDLAAKYYRRALAATPDSLAVRRSLVGVLARQGRLWEAITEFQPLMSSPRADGRLNTLLGDLYESVGNTPAAEAAYRLVCSRDPVHPEPARALGLFLLKQGRSEEGEAALRDALTRDPRDREARRALIRLAISRERLETAEIEARDALTIEPRDPEWLLVLARLLERMKRGAEAEVAFRAVVEADPNQADAREALARRAAERNDWPEAAAQWEALSKLKPALKLARRNLGLAYLELGRVDEARELIAPLAESGDADGLTHWLMGSIYRQKNRWRLAAQEFELAVRSDPAWAEAALEWAGALAELGEEDSALAALEPGLRNAGSSPTLLLRGGILLLRLKLADRAREVLENAARLAPDSARIRFQLGRACLEAGAFDAAVAAWEEAVRLDPKHADAFNHLGYLHADRNLKLDQAVRWIRKALALEPKNPNYHDSLGWAYFRLRRYPAALAEVQQAVRLAQAQGEPVDPEVYDHLGEIFWALRRGGEAAGAWEAALQGDPDNLDLRAKLERARRASARPAPPTR